MPDLKIIIQDKEKTTQAFEEVTKDNFAGTVNLISAAILEGGMQSGNTSVAFLIEIEKGVYAVTETSAAIILGLAQAIMGAELRFAEKKTKKN